MIAVPVPRESVNDESVIVQKVLVGPGGRVHAGDVIVEIETSKTTLQVESPAPGSVRHALEVGQEVSVGTVLFEVMEDTEAPSAKREQPHAQDSVAQSAQEGGEPGEQRVVLSKAAQATAARLGLDVGRLGGGWYTSRDILGDDWRQAAPARLAQPEGSFRAAWSAAEVDPQHGARGVSVPFRAVTLGKRKRAEIENLGSGAHAGMTSTIGIYVDLPGRRITDPGFLFRNSITDLVIFEAARLLREYPELNGFYVDSKTCAHYEEINVGVSFDNQRNLKVLAMRQADRMTLPDLRRAFEELLELFESNKPISRDLLATSTMTVSDLSTTDASFMLPLINGRQSLIVGIVRPHAGRFQLLASFDHRMAEGLQVARFLESLRRRVISYYRDESGMVDIQCAICSKSIQEEIGLGGRGFVKMVLPSGHEASVCRNCFEGL